MGAPGATTVISIYLHPDIALASSTAQEYKSTFPLPLSLTEVLVYSL